MIRISHEFLRNNLRIKGLNEDDVVIVVNHAAGLVYRQEWATRSYLLAESPTQIVGKNLKNVIRHLSLHVIWSLVHAGFGFVPEGVNAEWSHLSIRRRSVTPGETHCGVASCPGR